jgi:hypothetical protein
MANSKTITSGELRERLAKLVKGPVLGAGDPAYEESRRVFNAMIERRPAAILKCSGAEDVARRDSSPGIRSANLDQGRRPLGRGERGV